MEEKLNFEEFNISKKTASEFLGVSIYTLGKLNLPFVKVGETGRVKYRQSDLERIRVESIYPR